MKRMAAFVGVNDKICASRAYLRRHFAEAQVARLHCDR